MDCLRLIINIWESKGYQSYSTLENRQWHHASPGFRKMDMNVELQNYVKCYQGFPGSRSPSSSGKIYNRCPYSELPYLIIRASKNTNSRDITRLRNLLRAVNQPHANLDEFYWTDSFLPLANIFTMWFYKWPPCLHVTLS